MIVIAGNAFPDTHEEIARAIELGAEVVVTTISLLVLSNRTQALL